VRATRRTVSAVSAVAQGLSETDTDLRPHFIGSMIVPGDIPAAGIDGTATQLGE